ncbi:hypothetical protein L798_10037 [Zootermopsis nevadensis]|uniref:Uncharacterized protein n=1 Tax=Zootermopsis nevadensis TaxID=136037 RepID=A0A067R2V5_ZOONE|nr:hypothetical protein L798_10037 [Zootermopsis nevadensis]
MLSSSMNFFKSSTTLQLQSTTSTTLSWTLSSLLTPRNLPLICSSFVNPAACSKFTLSHIHHPVTPPPPGLAFLALRLHLLWKEKPQPQSYARFLYPPQTLFNHSLELSLPLHYLPFDLLSYIYHLLTQPPPQPNSPISGPFPCKTTLLNPQLQQPHHHHSCRDIFKKKRALGSKVRSYQQVIQQKVKMRLRIPFSLS